MIKRMDVINWSIRAFLSVIIIIILAIFLLEYKYQSQSFVSFRPEETIWKHRVNNDKILKETLEEGFKGIEIDIVFHQNSFFISHEITPTSNLLLSDFLKKLAPDLQIWLDLKNLNLNNANEIARHYDQLDEIYQLKHRSFIESTDGKALGVLANKNIPSLFWIYPYSNTRAHYFYNLKNKFLIATHSFIGISMDHIHLNHKTKKTFRNIPTFIFTVNDHKMINEFKLQENIKVILTDTIK